jgi:quaternary ammonium compound-resistance protein SugE
MAWVILVIAGFLGRHVLLGLAVRTLPLGTAYAVWTGIGTVGTAMLGMVVLGEPVTMLRVVLIGLIVCGILGLKAVH